MGCWNQTCLITHVPIPAGEPVKFFFLRGRRYIPTCKPTAYEKLPKKDDGQNDSKWLMDYLVGTTTGDCYSWDTWNCFGPPITAEYNDYGSIENIVEDEAFQLMSAYFKEYHACTVDEALDRIQRDSSFYAQSGTRLHREADDVYRYGWAMTPTFIYDRIVKGVGKDQPYWVQYEKSANVRAFYETKLKECIEAFCKAQKKEMRIFERTMILESARLLGREIVLRQEIVEACANHESLFDPTVDFIVFHDAMSSLRTMWQPQCGQGSQDSSYELHQLRCKAVDAYCKKQLADCE